MSNTLTQTAVRVDLPRSVTLVEPMIERRGRRWGHQQPEPDAEQAESQAGPKSTLNEAAMPGDTPRQRDSKAEPVPQTQRRSEPPSRASAGSPDARPEAPQRQPGLRRQPDLPHATKEPPEVRDQRGGNDSAQSARPAAVSVSQSTPKKRVPSPPAPAAGPPQPASSPAQQMVVAAPNVRPAGFPEAATEKGASGEHGAARERNEPDAIEVAFPKAGMGSDSPAQRRLPIARARATSPDHAGREALTSPVKILSKPRPLYPAQAREFRLQGDVLIDVEFRYSGTLEVLGVRQGLSPALNESALEATRKIRFLPARREGRPVDTQATVCIRFQLAP